MSWRTAGILATVVFLAMAGMAMRSPDPVLRTVVYLAAAFTAAAVATGRPVARWVNVVLVVFPGELALMTLLFEPPGDRAVAASATELLTRSAAVDAIGMVLVAGWAGLLALAHPHTDPGDPDP